MPPLIIPPNNRQADQRRHFTGFNAYFKAIPNSSRTAAKGKSTTSIRAAPKALVTRSLLNLIEGKTSTNIFKTIQYNNVIHK